MKIQEELLYELQNKIQLKPYGEKYMLIKEFVYQRFFAVIGPKEIIVNKGFVTDGASIPRIIRAISTPMSTDTLPAAIIHDYLYQNNIGERKIADEIFNEVMLLTGVSNWKRIMFYIGVRIGGWKAWREHLKSNKKLGKQQ